MNPHQDNVITLIFHLIAFLQGAFTLGATLVIFIYYLRGLKSFTWLHLHILLVAMGHLLLIAASLITLTRTIYPITDVWYWLAFFGYMLSDFALIVMIIKIKTQQKS